jgi:excinuclease ABC subunit B
MAEDLADYFAGKNIRVRYLHSNIDTLERIEILRGLRNGDFDVLVGINLLREGLDLPEVSLVAILDADKEGFLRSGTALIQTIGRASRNVNGTVIMYADNITGSIKYAVDETNRRRNLQAQYNEKNGIVPVTISKNISDILFASGIKSKKESRKATATASAALVSEKRGSFTEDGLMSMDLSRIDNIISGLEEEMHLAAQELDFEKAAIIRDEIKRIKKIVRM